MHIHPDLVHDLAAARARELHRDADARRRSGLARTRRRPILRRREE